MRLSNPGPGDGAPLPPGSTPSTSPVRPRSRRLNPIFFFFRPEPGWQGTQAPTRSSACGGIARVPLNGAAHPVKGSRILHLAPSPTSRDRRLPANRPRCGSELAGRSSGAQLLPTTTPPLPSPSCPRPGVSRIGRPRRGPRRPADLLAIVTAPHDPGVDHAARSAAGPAVRFFFFSDFPPAISRTSTARQRRARLYPGGCLRPQAPLERSILQGPAPSSISQ